MSEESPHSEQCSVKGEGVQAILVADGMEVTWTPVSGAKSYLVSLFHEGEDTTELEKIKEEPVKCVHVFKSFRGTKYFCSVLAQNEDQTPIGKSRTSNTVSLPKEPDHNVETPDSSNEDHEREDEAHADNNTKEKEKKVEGQNSETGDKGEKGEASGDNGEHADDTKTNKNSDAESSTDTRHSIKERHDVTPDVLKPEVRLDPDNNAIPANKAEIAVSNGEDEVPADNKAQENEKKVEGQNSETEGDPERLKSNGQDNAQETEPKIIKAKSEKRESVSDPGIDDEDPGANPPPNKGENGEAGSDNGEPADDPKINKNLDAESGKAAGDSSVNSPEADAITGDAVLSSDDESDSDTDDRKYESSADKGFNYDFRIKMKKKKVVCTWNKLDDVKIYFVTIRARKKQHDPIRCETNEVTFSKSQFKLHFGDSFEIRVEPENGSGKSDFVSLKIGGRTEPRGVTAVRCADKPSDIIVKWNPPEAKPHRYEVTIMQHNKKGTKLPVTNTQVTFNDIKNPRGSCRFKVKPVYKHRKKVISAFSEEMEPIDQAAPITLNITWRKQEFSVSWCGSCFAKSYDVTVSSDMSNIAPLTKKSVTDLSATFDMRKGYWYGNKCNFRVIDSSGNQKPHTKDAILGEGLIPSMVKLEHDESDPCRKLYLSWQKPKIDADSYKVTLWRPDSKTKPVKSVGVDTTTISFDNLHPAAKYRCEVVAMYDGKEATGRGVMSNVLKTNERPHGDDEKKEDFGKVKGIRCELIRESGNMYGNIYWDSVKLNENFKHTGYEGQLKQEGKVFEDFLHLSLVKVTRLPGNDKKEGCKTDNLARGKKYILSITHVFVDVDTENKKRKTAEYAFYTPPRLNKFDQKPGTKEMTISWEAVSGVMSYKLHIKDRELEKTLLEKKVDDTKYTFDLAKVPIRVGCTCMIKLYPVMDSDTVSVTLESSLVTVGGKILPRDVIAELHAKNPCRSVRVKFDRPNVSKGLSTYEVEAIPQKGQKKSLIVKPEDEVIFTYLKQNTLYTFFVRAIYESGSVMSEWSVSNPLITKNTGKSYDELPENENFGKVRNYRKQKVRTILPDKIRYSISWNAPDFGGRDDIEIEKISCLVQTADGGSDNLMTDATSLQCDLEVGKVYKVKITTHFLLIDKEEKRTAVLTKTEKIPIDKPTDLDVSWNIKQLTFSWKKCFGVSEYEWDIVDASDNMKILKQPTKWSSTTKTFDMRLSYSYGRQCLFRVKALHHGNSSDHATIKTVIGCPHVPTSVIATPATSDPERGMCMTWNEPSLLPSHGYKVNIVRPGLDWSFSDVAELTSYTFWRLTPNVKYQCNVSAVYDGKPMHAVKSDVQTTKERSKTTEEDSSNFGLPSDEVKPFIGYGEGAAFVEIFCPSACLGKNYKFKQYVITLPNGAATETRTCAQNEFVKIENLLFGRRYEVTITTEFYDIDKMSIIRKMDKKYNFLTKPLPPEEIRCIPDVGAKTIEFRWDYPKGCDQDTANIKMYRVLIERRGIDPLQNESSDNKIIFPMRKDLRMGTSCRIKVVTVTREDELVESGSWKLLDIGPDNIPRNVLAQRNPSNTRWMDITLEHPLCAKTGRKPDFYIVQAFPETGEARRLKKFPRETQITMKYLRHAINYRFDVKAQYGDDVTEIAAQSNTEVTAGDPTSLPSLIHVENAKTLDLKHATVKGHKQAPKQQRRPEFGQVMNLRVERKSGKDEDIFKIQWNSPNFVDKNDYKIDHYIVKVTTENGKAVLEVPRQTRKICFVEDIKLPIGGIKYHVYVVTVFEDIDLDQGLLECEAVNRLITTRPYAVSGLIHHWGEKTLRLKWNSAGGAKSYKFCLYNDNGETIHARNLNKDQTSCDYEIDEKEVGFGRKCIIEVETIGEAADLTNSKKIDIIVGGDRVPQNVGISKYTEDGQGEHKKGLVTWNEPKEKPTFYLVHAIPLGSAREKRKVEEKTECEFLNLLAGTKYTFGVSAVTIDESNKEQESQMCLSIEIETEPKPNKLCEVTAKPDRANPSTSIRIEWEKLGDKVANKFGIEVTSLQCTTTFETDSRGYVMKGLMPTTSYSVKVKAGNESGYGQYSDPVDVITEPGEASKVIIETRTDSPSSELLLSFMKSAIGAQDYKLQLRETRSGKCRTEKLSEIQNNSEGNDDRKFQLHPNATSNAFKKDANESADTVTILLPGLKPNTKFEAAVTAYYEDGRYGRTICSNCCWTATKTENAPRVEKALELDSKGRSSRNVLISWEPQSKCQEYEVFVECSPETEAKISVHGVQLRYYCKNESRQYIFRVRSKNKSRHFGEKSPAAIVQLAPPAPTNVKAERCGSDIKVTWCQTIPCGHEIEIFEDEKLKRTPTVPLEEGKTFLFESKNQKPAKEYYFLVRGLICQETAKQRESDDKITYGRCAKSNYITSTPEVPALASAIVNISQHNPSTCIEAYITEFAPQMCDYLEIAITQLKHGESESAKLLLPKGGSKVRVDSLQPGCLYGIKMRNWWRHTESCWSNEKRLLLAPGRIYLKRFEGKDRTISMEWQRMSENEITYHITLYEKRYGNADFCEKVNEDVGTLTTFVTENLEFASEYYYEVYAKNEAGNGSKLKTDIYKCPWKRPERIKVEITDELRFRGAVLSWERPDGIENFKLQMDDRVPIALDDCTYKFDRGVPGHFHEFRLYCECDGKFDTKCTKATLRIPPAKPKSVMAEADESESDKILVFVGEPLPQPLKYRVAIYSLPENEEIKVVLTISNKHTFFGIKPGKKYMVGVKSHDGVDYESRECYSNEVQPVAILPQNIRVQSKENDPTIRIVEFDDQKNPRKSYKVTARNMNDGTTISQSTTGHRVEVDGFKRGKRYAVEIETFIDEMSLGKSYYRGPNERGPRKEN